ncbi:hypothetical protein F0562_013971 [Nyssa sinensis]|uniref:Uncharacterized protein n=1 Tax=Nyssa sinensis TaxID=561372 RepID=A0A5J4ZM58_9ASTE|nr:hypothetical protein F0562_013971 [Nyssa sinensis]
MRGGVHIEEGARRDTSSTESDPYCIEACMDVLDSLVDISDGQYHKACTMFLEDKWLTMFIRMPEERKLNWVLKL